MRNIVTCLFWKKLKTTMEAFQEFRNTDTDIEKNWSFFILKQQHKQVEHGTKASQILLNKKRSAKQEVRCINSTFCLTHYSHVKR